MNNKKYKYEAILNKWKIKHGKQLILPLTLSARNFFLEQKLKLLATENTNID